MEEVTEKTYSRVEDGAFHFVFGLRNSHREGLGIFTGSGGGKREGWGRCPLYTSA